jgi:dipeptidyl aminopeptidase/acylaminoacyl peptidase
MVKRDEGHGFRKEENRYDFYGEMDKFLARHLKQE